jgi:hypothetical protein
MGQVPSLPTEAMRAIDAAAGTAYAIDTTQLMEIAGFQVARAAVAMLDGVQGKRVVVAAGEATTGETPWRRRAFSSSGALTSRSGCGPTSGSAP